MAAKAELPVAKLYHFQMTWWCIIERMYSSLIPTQEFTSKVGKLAMLTTIHRKLHISENFIPSEHIKVDHVVLSKFVDCHHAHNVV